MLRDMRTRYFNHGLGFIMVPLWPLVHMSVLILIHGGLSHGSPAFGDSTAIFVATGLVPTLTFMYMSRYMGWSLWQNRAMLAFPIVTALDVMFGRAFLEMISACIMITALIFALTVLGENPAPVDINNAVEAFLATIYLAFGCGVLVGAIALFHPFLLTVWQLCIVCIYLSSGTMFVAQTLPDQLSYWLSFNPVLQCVEWMRMGFYESYSDKLLSKQYVLAFGSVAMFLGLIIERLFRRMHRDG